MTDMQMMTQVVLSSLLLGGVYALVAAGFNLIYGVMDIINCAQADMMMVAMYVTYWSFALSGIHPLLALVINIPLFFAIGVLVQKWIIDRLLGAPLFIQAVATIGLGYVTQNLALLFWKEDYRMILIPYTESVLTVGGLHISVPRLVSFIGSIVVVACLYVFLRKTDFGVAIRATSESREAASLMGINVKRVYAVVFGIGVACAGIAGVFTSTFYYAYPMVGTAFLLKMFVVVVVGGCGNLLASIAGGLTIGLAEGIGAFVLGASWKEAIYQAVFLIVLALRPEGIFGRSR
jgi:branched-chain amino acid transport system permease protein